MYTSRGKGNHVLVRRRLSYRSESPICLIAAVVAYRIVHVNCFNFPPPVFGLSLYDQKGKRENYMGR